MVDLRATTIKDIVTKNFHTAAVFEKYSLDFCCRGGKTIEEASRERGLDPVIILKEVLNISSSTDYSNRFNEWESDFLVDYIVQNHHAYVSKMISVISAHTQKVATVHGANHPEVIEIANHFAAVAAELQSHMRKEEQILFPYITSLCNAKRTGMLNLIPAFGTVRNPIRMMESEHQQVGDEMYSIRALSNGYAPPEDACTTYRIAYQELREFEQDLHQHIHLENNILFPKALELETSLIFAQ
jgi:regulator of cell morphogenesis and NO signaling